MIVDKWSPDTDKESSNGTASTTYDYHQKA